MILTHGGKYLSDAFADLLENFDEIKIFTSTGGIHSHSFNKNLLQLFSPFMRRVFESIPRECAEALIIPDVLSDNALLQGLEELLSKGITSSGSISSKCLEDLADLGKLLGLNLSRIVYGEKLPTESSTFLGFHSDVGSSRNDIGGEFHEAELKTVREGKCDDQNIRVKQENQNYYCSSTFDKVWDEGMCGHYPMQEINEFQGAKVPFTSEKHDKDYSIGTDVNSNNTHSVKKEPTDEALDTSIDSPLPVYASSGSRMTDSALPKSQLDNVISQDFITSFLQESRKRLSSLESQDQPPNKKLKTSFTCEWCNVYKTPSEEVSKMHFAACKILNLDRKLLRCRICKLAFVNPILFHFHLKVDHREAVAVCVLCEFTSFDKHDICIHRRRHHMKSYTECDCTGSTGVAALNRVKTKHGNEHQGLDESRSSSGHGRHQIYSCSKCNYIGKDDMSLRQHFSVKHDGKDLAGSSYKYSCRQGNYLCTKCDYVTKNEVAIRQHSRVKHAIEESVGVKSSARQISSSKEERVSGPICKGWDHPYDRSSREKFRPVKPIKKRGGNM